jgi:glycerate 2-kinase
LSTRPVPLEPLPELNELHRYARAIFDHALSAVDPRKAVNQAIRVDGPFVEIGEARLELSSHSIYAIAIGKAATSMAIGLEEALGEKLSAGVVVSGAPLPTSKRWQSFAGGHPLPNEASLAAAQAVFALLDRANAEAAIVVFLISGGGSAMIEWPVSEEISLADLRAANQDLVSCGAAIAEVNSIRRAFSAVKGGGLARRAPRAQMLTLIVSDANHGDEASVASGPTLDVPPNAPRAIEVVEHYHLDTVLPESIMKAVREGEVTTGGVNGSHIVLLDNRTAIYAACKKAFELNLDCATLDDVCEQPIQEGCDLLLSALFAHPVKGTFCAVSGGEFSCPVRGDGRGGRNLETALRCSTSLANHPAKDQHFVVLSAGTDGVDGNSPAAGAIADETTLARAQRLGLDADQYLASSDSFSFFEQLNDLIVTGPTGTNVRDLRILLRR